MAACGQKFISGNSSNYTYNYPDYAYNGTIRGILRNVVPRPPLITVQGCRDLCGEGSNYYSLVDMSSTITTWVRFLSIQAQSAANFRRYCRSSASFYKLPSKATRISTAFWRLRVGLATQSRASLTSYGTSKSRANVR